MNFWGITPTVKKIHPFAPVWCEIGVLWANIIHVKSHTTASWLLTPNRYESNLSNEELFALVGQEAAKISEVKAEGL